MFSEKDFERLWFLYKMEVSVKKIGNLCSVTSL